MDSFRNIIDLWPTRADLAADLGVDRDTLSLWYHRNRIPSGYWVRLAQAAERRKIPDLNAMTLLAVGQKEDAA